MNLVQARRTGSRAAIKSLSIVLAILFVVGLLVMAKDDPANNLLFFIHDLFSPVMALLLVFLYFTAWLFGRRAGKAILLKHKGYFLTGTLYGVVTFLLLWVMINGPFLWSVYRGHYEQAEAGRNVWTGYTLPFGGLEMWVFLGCLLITWLCAAWAIKLKEMPPADRS